MFRLVFLVFLDGRKYDLPAHFSENYKSFLSDLKTIFMVSLSR